MFHQYATTEQNPNWEKLIQRKEPLYSRVNEIRSPFARDYTRILHSMAYRRLKHKTQVFFDIDNDHVCTRMEHVHHVESVSSTIARYLGLNEELTKAIALGHDLGHAPFGHHGETVIKKLSLQYLQKDFSHEQNGLRFVDEIELLEDNNRVNRNLDLTYAVRDGILSHCGEVDQNGIFPRDISISIDEFDAAGKYQAVTWEGCLVKIADKIAYVGRDIEDAIALGFLSQRAQIELMSMAQGNHERVINTTVIIHNMILDICKNSSPENGISMSVALNQQLKQIKDFNYREIYDHKRFQPFKHYSELVITQLFETLLSLYDDRNTWQCMNENKPYASKLIGGFEEWLVCYCERDIVPEGYLMNRAQQCENVKIYSRLETKELYIQAIIDYISGMTDRYAIELFYELIKY